MLAERLAILVVIGTTSGWVWAVLVRRCGLRSIHVLAVLAPVVAVVLAAWWALEQRTLAVHTDRLQLEEKLPILGREEYASSSSCRACHPAEYASWHETFHRTMTQVALPETVLGHFPERTNENPTAAATVSSNGLSYSVYRRGDAFWAEMPDPEIMMYAIQGGRQTGQFTYLIKPAPDAPVQSVDLRAQRVERRVVMSTGSHHYQTYWVPGDEKYGRLLQTLPLIWLKKDQRWIPREAAFMHPPGVRMITQWNHHCIRCHSTGGVPGLVEKFAADGSPAGTEFQTRVADLGIACEACHGPARAHVEANQDPLRRYQLHRSGRNDPTIVNPERLDHKRSTQVCGQCHGVYIHNEEAGMQYAKEGTLYRPGEDLHEKRYYIQHPESAPSPERWAEFRRQPQFYSERWWDDGTVLAGGREYTGLVVSACYTRGEISCLSCHSMHHSDPADQLKPGMETSRACTQCHGEPQYTSRIESHTHHDAASSGSNCLNCHMPHTTYALFSAIRSHQIGSPRLSSAADHGVPHACNLCHLDKTLAWTQEHLENWYGQQEPVTLTPEQREVSAALLWMLKGHAAQRAIVAWHFGWEPAQSISGTDWLAPMVAQLLNDPYGVVRYVAKESLRSLPGFEEIEFDFLAPEAAREASREAVVERWKQLPRETRQGSTAILLDSNGNLQSERLRELWLHRDNRPVTIKE